MKQWIKTYKWQLLLSTLLGLVYILAGVILWDRLPEQMVSHWGADGAADGMAGKGFMVFGVGGIVLGLHILCVFLAWLDKNTRKQSKKAASIIFWIVPWIGVFLTATVYPIALGQQSDPLKLLPGLMGVLFMCLGNVMPKLTRNHTLGIKVYWTLGNEENWNKTHRFAGKVWFFGGLGLLATMLLPKGLAIPVMIVLLVALVAGPMVYSYWLYRRHKQQGIVYEIVTQTKAGKVGTRIAMILVPLILIGVAILMFTGDITYTLEGERLQIEAWYYADATVELDTIDTLELAEDFEAGHRQMGFGSARLSMGQFFSDELGVYISYRYTGCDSAIILTSGEDILVINCASEEETRQLFDQLQQIVE